ncbi:MAG: exopolysaccharide biosynthesis polyprenyl glycosylphosphotransferase [bacterium]
MNMSNRRDSLVLFLGDFLLFTISLTLAVFIRYGRLPEEALFVSYLWSFSIIFVASAVVFFIVGLYDKHTVVLKGNLPQIIFRAQLANALIAIIIFYLIPYFGITPKTILFLYIFISFLLISSWRGYLYPRLGVKNKQKTFLIGRGQETSELLNEVNNNFRYGFTIVSYLDLDSDDEIDFQNDILNKIKNEGISLVIVDLHHDKAASILPDLYSLIFSGVVFIDMRAVYEDIFDRVPLSLLEHSWFLENMSLSPHPFYDLTKRIMDIILSALLLVFFVVVTPFVFLAIKIEDRGPIFITQRRVGKGNRPVTIYKFRSMQGNEEGVWIGETANKVTKVGKFLRYSRIDELPQLWNVFRGDISLIGPRPDVVGLDQRLISAIPYYNTRYLIKPGLSGWAQIRQIYQSGNISPQSVDESTARLAYDLYYIENRSFVLDIKIALKTLKILFSRLGI